MGLLVDGQWTKDEYAARNKDGRFQFHTSGFRNWVTADGSPGPSGEGGFKAEPGRYHLYISLACPWACRALIVRRLKGLDGMIGLTNVKPLVHDEGWELAPGSDPVNNASRMHQIYTRADPGATCRVTVPVLWDKERGTIVNNESSEIIRMFNSAFDGCGADASLDLYPDALAQEIDAVNARVFEGFNLGVYKTGFAGTQETYEEAARLVFETLDWMEQRMAGRAWIVGEQMTEADWRAFTTLVRFDPVYYGHFKCNVRMIADYPSLSAYLERLYAVPGVAETVDIGEIKAHYYGSMRHINPLGIVPKGPHGVVGTPPWAA